MDLAMRAPSAEFRWVIFSGEEIRANESRAAARALISDQRRVAIEFKQFKGSYFPGSWSDIKDEMHRVSNGYVPDIIFTHRLDDRHQDHRVVAELTWHVFRDNLIFEYEIPKFEGDLGHPNFYARLATDLVEKKIAALLELFPSQRERGWFRAETFRGLLALRGVECNAPSGYAEAFQVRKLVL
jgi:LmbE family N-acetylglucosaminyl deacetylase